jgi:glycosyltransferase involved in cell wall biosynthesis
VLKTVKYLRDFGWEPVVYTAKDAAYPVIDVSLLKDVAPDLEIIRGPIWEPYELYKRFTSQNKKERVYSGFMTDAAKPSFTQRASVWIRGNFFIPDARKFWIAPSVKLLKAYLTDHPVDAILSSGPPHSTHMIARALKRKFGTPWLADFRDPWTNIDFYDQLMLTGWADKKHKAQEQAVIREADRMLTVSWSWGEDFRRLGRADIETVTNGFDEADFPATMPERDQNFTICHIGSLNRDRNSPPLWETLAKMARANADFKAALRLRFIGKTEANTFAQLADLGLEANTEQVAYMPHGEVIAELGRAHVLLLLTNDTLNVLGVVPGKIYEYLAARRPILAIGTPAGDSARILRETGAGVMCGFRDRAAMEEALTNLFADYQKGSPAYAGDAEAIRRFTRRGATERVAEILDGMV